mmetsp:Transcript_18474/g.56738  ORF Transcript_18474/g.56738 Transcript_18474/m.56738 type:complete len:443 (-) Transcript_18474:927-2255(-)
MRASVSERATTTTRREGKERVETTELEEEEEEDDPSTHTTFDGGPEAGLGVDGGAGAHADVGDREAAEALLGREGVVADGEVEVEVAEEGGEHDGGFEDGELVAEAAAAAGAEGHEGVVRGLFVRVERRVRDEGGVVALPAGGGDAGDGVLLALEARGVEGLGVVPEEGGFVEGPRGEEDVGASRERDGRVGEGGSREFVGVEGSSNEQRRLRVEPQAFREGEAGLLGSSDVLVGEAVAVVVLVEDGVDFVADRRQMVPGAAGGVEELVDDPGQQRGRGFVAGHQHGHQVVAELRVRRLFAAHRHEEVQQRDDLRFFVVVLLLRVEDQLVELSVQEVEVVVELSLVRNHVARTGNEPEREKRGGSAFGLGEAPVHCADERAFGGGGAEVVVEDGSSDDVERRRAESFLDVHDVLGRRRAVLLPGGPLREGRRDVVGRVGSSA